MTRKDITSSEIYELFKRLRDDQLVDGMRVEDLRTTAVAGIKIHASHYVQLFDLVKKYVELKELEEASNE